MAGLVLQKRVVERRQQFLLVVIIHDRAADAQRIDQFVNAEIVENIQRRRMNGRGARMLVNDVTLVEQRHLDAGPSENETDDQTDWTSTRDDDALWLRHH